ncbi:cytidine deaminase [Mesonia ostreae]|uniref:Cytidine deaminase n=1 Tax=Mesonia ostreae TaxID=861110 RepID=A0ABU2KH22_9FLAO|nr:cytidine deaminase [Mesonia ostreae]MDT0294013.1 cytidine deaminase [Mesonia ostreae]
MEERKITTSIQIFENIEELPPQVKFLMKEAQAIRDQAYAPYSKFKVGAAIQLEDDIIVTGSNQENAAYPSGLCAERTAIFYAGSQYPNKKVKAMAICVKSSSKVVTKPIAPCGACRQAIAEYEVKQDQPIEIYFMGEEGKIIKAKALLDLLPLAFDASFL